MSFVKKMLAKKRAVETAVQKRKAGVLESYADLVELKYLPRMLKQAATAHLFQPSGCEREGRYKGRHQVYRVMHMMATLTTHYAEITRFPERYSPVPGATLEEQLESLWRAIREVWHYRVYQRAIDKYRDTGHVIGAGTQGEEGVWRKDEPEKAALFDAEVREAFTVKGEVKVAAQAKTGPKKVMPRKHKKRPMRKVKP